MLNKDIVTYFLKMDCPHFARTSFFFGKSQHKKASTKQESRVLALIFHIHSAANYFFHSVANCFTIPTILSCKLFLSLCCKLFHNSHNTQSCQITSKLFHNFYNVASIQNSSKLDFVFSLHYIASLYARICSSFVQCSLRSAPSFSFILGMKKAPTFDEAFSLVA